MKKIIFVFSMAILTNFSCKKNEFCQNPNTTAPAIEVNKLRNYIDSIGITTIEDQRGFFYIIHNLGVDEKPNNCSTVTVNYEGKLVDGTIFDSGNNVSFLLSDLITGWQEGIPLIAKGGSITLYLPPSLAYGSSGSGGIPANSNLIFKIDLIKFKK